MHRELLAADWRLSTQNIDHAHVKSKSSQNQKADRGKLIECISCDGSDIFITIYFDIAGEAMDFLLTWIKTTKMVICSTN